MKTLSRRLLFLLSALSACGDGQGDGAPAAPESDSDAPPNVRRVLAALRQSVARRRCELLYFKALMLKATTGEFPATLDELVGAENPHELPLDAEEVSSGEPKGEDPWSKALDYEVVIKVETTSRFPR
jgi:hypothetical protein